MIHHNKSHPLQFSFKETLNYVDNILKINKILRLFQFLITPETQKLYIKSRVSHEKKMHVGIYY